jgi:hypothetical protein
MYRRRRPEDDPASAADAAQQPATETPGPETPGAAPPDPGSGPYDREAPEDGVPRLDFGGLQVPLLAGMEVRLEVSPPPEQIVQSVTIADAASAIQLSAFAAPRSQGIWTEVRGEIAEALRTSGGSAAEVDGEHGPELAAQIPDPSGQRQPARFLGVDGPRWFLRAVLTGAAALDPAAAVELRAGLRRVVVVRGAEAMTVREQIPLRLPREAAAAMAGEGPPADGQDGYPPPGVDDLNPFERGPEITETR